MIRKTQKDFVNGTDQFCKCLQGFVFVFTVRGAKSYIYIYQTLQLWNPAKFCNAEAARQNVGKKKKKTVKKAGKNGKKGGNRWNKKGGKLGGG